VVALVLTIAAVSGACSREDAFEPPAASPDAKPGGTLRVGITAPSSIDPVLAADPMGMLVVRTMCDALLGFDVESGDEVPAVAETWQMSSSGQHLNIKLRRGARFSNGDSVTADDVRFTLSRVARQETASPFADLLRSIDGYGWVHGDDDTDSAERREQLSGVKVIANDSFEVLLTDHVADFARVLSHTMASPVPRRLVERDPDAFSAQPVCAGPYALAAPWRAGDREIRLVRAERETTGAGTSTRGGAGYADEIVFSIYESADAAVDGYRRGEVDVVEVPGDRLGSVADLSADLVRTSDGLIEYVGLPARVPPFDRPEVRRALSLAIDRGAIASTVFGGGREPATGFLPPTVGDGFRKDACGGALPAAGDVDAARALLRDAGVDLTGVPLAFAFNDELGNRSIVDAVAQQWHDALGVVVTAAPDNWEHYLATGQGQTGFTSPFRFSTRAAYPGADPYLFGVFHSSRIGSDNFARWIDPYFDRIADRGAHRAEEAEDRVLDYQRLEDVLCEQLPMLPLVFGGASYLVRHDRARSSRDVVTSTAWGEPALRDLYLVDAEA
jgi:ABC-type oligopeptide transport system substrate-binding subunit